jgi:predicted nucleic acid-binding protein
LASFEIIAVTETVAERAVKLRRVKRMKLPDTFILAGAIEHGLLFVTRNTKDFDSRWPGVRIPYTVK